MKVTHQALVALMFAILLACAAHGSTIDAPPSDTPVDALKGVYLVCERASTHGTLSADGVAYCKIVFERLERRQCETGLSQAIVSRRDYSSKDCGRLKVLLPRATAP